MLVSRWVLVVAMVAAGGCASGGTPTLAQKFVRQGVPSVDMGGPKPKIPSRTERASSPLEHASVTTVPSRISSSASSLENVYPALRDAMWQLRFAPTPAHYIAVARVYRRLGIIDTAHDFLARSLAENGPDPAVLDALARLWRDWGRPDEALSFAYRAAYLAPHSATAQNTLGTVLFALGKRGEAGKRFEEAVKLEPSAPWALQNLCVAYQAEGRTREAITTCRKADAAKRKSPAESKESR